MPETTNINVVVTQPDVLGVSISDRTPINVSLAESIPININFADLNNVKTIIGSGYISNTSNLTALAHLLATGLSGQGRITRAETICPL